MLVHQRVKAIKLRQIPCFFDAEPRSLEDWEAAPEISLERLGTSDSNGASMADDPC